MSLLDEKELENVLEIVSVHYEAKFSVASYNEGWLSSSVEASVRFPSRSGLVCVFQVWIFCTKVRVC